MTAGHKTEEFVLKRGERGLTEEFRPDLHVHGVERIKIAKSSIRTCGL